MDWQPVERPADAFQRPVTPDQVLAICRRAFGGSVNVAAAVELGGGMYNTTYRLVFDEGPAAILRVAPEPARQFRSEQHLMRNEFAALPYFAPVAALMPQVLAVDFTHDLIGRDWMVQSHLDGLPAPELLGSYTPEQQEGVFAQLGELARRIHAVRGPAFGPVAGPAYASWSDAVIAALEAAALDLDAVGLSAGDVREVAKVADEDRALLDGITVPRLLHGDLWTVKVMLRQAAERPDISGLFDCDRAWWGDPAADWTIHMARQKPRPAFWRAYGPEAADPASARHALYYRARHLAAIRLERHRMGTATSDTYDVMRDVLDLLG